MPFGSGCPAGPNLPVVKCPGSGRSVGSELSKFLKGLGGKKIVARNNGQQPPYGGPRAYDIVYSYKHCIEQSGVTNKSSDLAADREKIRTCLAGLKNFPGVAGEITMDENRDGAGSSAILKVVNGKYVNVAK